MNIFYKISIDHVNGNYISGWCYHRLWKTRPLVLQLYRGGELIAETTCDRFREDLKALRLHPTGRCGFEFVSASENGFDTSQPLAIRVKGGAGQLAEFKLSTWMKRPPSSRQSFSIRKKSAETVVFMHIPKTAGTSFNTLAQSLYPGGSTISHIELVDTQSYPALLHNYRYISGHLRFGLLEQHFGGPKTVFYTIVRDPYKQLHSHLKWMIQTAQNPEEKFFKATNKVIYRLGLRIADIDFSSRRSLETFVNSLDDLEAAFLDNIQARYFLDDQPRRVCLDDMKTILANASRFRLIGVTERYEDFVNRFKNDNDLDGPVNLQQLNISKSTDLFDYRNEAIQEILKPLVTFDLRLHRRVVQNDYS